MLGTKEWETLPKQEIWSYIVDEVLEILEQQTNEISSTQLLKLLYTGNEPSIKKMIQTSINYQSDKGLKGYHHKGNIPSNAWGRKGFLTMWKPVQPKKEMTTEERRAVIKSHEEQAAREALKDIL